MRRYLLIETKGVWAGPGCSRFCDDALALSLAGHDVSLTLLADGVTAAVPGALHRLAEFPRGAVLAERLSLAARAMTAGELAPQVEVTELDAVARRLLEPDVKVVWH